MHVGINIPSPDVIQLFDTRVDAMADAFNVRLENYFNERVTLGARRADVLRELDADFAVRGPLYSRLVAELNTTIDWGMNTQFQVSANPPAEVGVKFKWVLDPKAEHCDSCLYQEKQPPRTFEDIPIPTQQPTHGDTNCGPYCKCQLIAA